MPSLDHSSHERFYDYYAEASQSGEAHERFRSIRDCALRVLQERGLQKDVLDVADIGCGAGTQSMLWAEKGHRVHGLDVNEPLLKLAVDRAAGAGYQVDFRTGGAGSLPWLGGSMDVCLLVELLEHVADWEACLNECTRILRPGGILVLTTTNRLCPRQQEFNLPFYSWYPRRVKRYFEHLAVTTRPDLANYAKYPAVNWFSFYGLQRVLAGQGFRCLDRFDIAQVAGKAAVVKMLIEIVRALPAVRWLAHVSTPGTMLVGVKNAGEAR